METSNIEDKIKNKVIDWIVLGAGGRLIISKPEKNPLGADLLVEKRGEYKENNILFKVCSLIGPAESIELTKDFIEDQFKADKNLYLLFVYFDSVKQKISDHIWLVPSLQFKDMAESIESKNGQTVLRFESFLDVGKKDKYSKFLIHTQDFGKLVLDSFDSAKKFNFKESILSEAKIISEEALKNFISQARANTYAAGNNPTDNPRLMGSIQLEFQKEELLYRDIYFLGDKNFIGQEIVYQNSKPIWGMNYLGNSISPSETSFLKEALLSLFDKCRFGQTCEFRKKELKYEDSGQGNLENFFGEEKIFLSEKSIYKLNYRGGLIYRQL